MRAGMMLMLIPLAIAGIVSFFTFKTYPVDAAAAAAYAERTSEKSGSPKNQTPGKAGAKNVKNSGG